MKVTSGEVVGFGVVVKFEWSLVAVFAEEVDDPLLLLGREPACAVVVAVVGGVFAEVALDLVAQVGSVFLLHVCEECLEAPGGADEADGAEAPAALLRAGVGEDADTFVDALAEAQARLIVEAGFGLGAIRLEAAAEGRGYLLYGQFGWHILKCFLGRFSFCVEARYQIQCAEDSVFAQARRRTLVGMQS